jgi:hypothetical protein
MAGVLAAQSTARGVI